MESKRQFKQFIDRILRLKEEQDTIGDDVKEVYAELKAWGGDKTAAGALVSELRRKAKDSTKFEEGNAILDLYRAAYEEASGTQVATHTHAPEASHSYAAQKGRGVEVGVDTPHDPSTGELTETQVSEGVPSLHSASASHASDESEAYSGIAQGRGEGSSLPVSVSNPTPATNPHSAAPSQQPNTVGGDAPPVAVSTDSAPGHVPHLPSDRAPSEAGAHAAASRLSSDPYDPGDIPAFLRRSDGYAKLSGRA